MKKTSRNEAYKIKIIVISCIRTFNYTIDGCSKRVRCSKDSYTLLRAMPEGWFYWLHRNRHWDRYRAITSTDRSCMTLLSTVSIPGTSCSFHETRIRVPILEFRRRPTFRSLLQPRQWKSRWNRFTEFREGISGLETSFKVSLLENRVSSSSWVRKEEDVWPFPS